MGAYEFEDEEDEYEEGNVDGGEDLLRESDSENGQIDEGGGSNVVEDDDGDDASGGGSYSHEDIIYHYEDLFVGDQESSCNTTSSAEI
jgi:hypothetical protein